MPSSGRPQRAASPTSRSARSADFAQPMTPAAGDIVTSVTTSVMNAIRGVFTPNVSGYRSTGTKVPPKRRRIVFMFTLFMVFFAIILGQVARLQVLENEKYIAYGQEQRTNSQILAADRGVIVDRNGEEMVISRPATSVFVDPKLINDPETEARAVAPILGLDPNVVQAKMTANNRFGYLARKVDPALVDQVKQLKLPGVAFIEEPERFLTAGTSGRSLLGSVDVDNVGLSGLEKQYGDVLTGTPGTLALERGPTGRTIAVGEHSLTPAVRGDNLRLTIDRSIQFEAERLLADQVRISNAKGAIAIVSSTATGELLAVANVVRDTETGEIVNGTNASAITTQYEPGSVMKLITIAGAMENKKIEPNTQFDLPPTLTYYDATFGEAEGRGSVRWDVGQILTHSSNVGTIKIAEKLGKDELYSYQTLFGFGSPTGLGYPNEALGWVLSPSKYSGTSLPSIAIGQGISVSPVQMLAAYNVIANNGVYIAPKLVHSTVDSKGIEHPTGNTTTRRVISEATSDKLNIILRDVVSEGTGKQAAVNGYTVAGKTGTSRKPQPGGGYTDRFGVTRYQSTFVGFAPAEQPALSVYVMIDEPSGAYTGGATAAPVFSKLMSFSLKRMGIAPAATDAANGGAPAAVQDAPVNTGQAVMTAGDRVRALTTGSAEANKKAVQTSPTAGAAGSTTTTTIRPR